MPTFVDFVSAIQSSVVALGFPRTPISEGTPLTKETIDLVPVIVGTGFQASVGKIATCAHVAKALAPHASFGESRIITIDRKTRYIRFWAMSCTIKNYVDRNSKIDETVDCGFILTLPKAGAAYPTVPVTWGDSDKVAIGEEVGICGFPMGDELFIDPQNKKIVGFGYTVQKGIVSAILPVDHPAVSRELFQLDIQTYGGMSGGPVFLANTGEVIGMVQSQIQTTQGVTNITYAVPGNVIEDCASRISFKDSEGTKY